MNEKKAPVMRVRDMSTGNPIRLILAFAIPLFIGNVFQQFYNMVDTMVVGYTLGDSAISAIGATSSLYSLLINFASGLNAGYGIIVTQRFGAKDHAGLKQAVSGMILLDLAAVALLTGLSAAFLRPLMVFMNTPASILDQAYGYMIVICCGMVSTVGYNMFAGILRALGNSRTPLYFLIVSSVLNILLDLLLVAKLHMGLPGAATATVISQSISAALCGLYLLRNYRELMPAAADFRVPGKLLGELLSMGVSVGMMNCLVEFSSVIFQRANNGMGETIIAAHTAARKIIMLMIQPLGTISTAFSTFTAQNWGAQCYGRIRSTLKKVLGMVLLWSILACSVVYLFGSGIIRLTTGTEDPEIIRNAVMSMRIHLPFYPLLGTLFCLRHSLQSMGSKSVPIFSSCLELAIKIFSAGVLIPALGYLGTCITEPAAWTVMAAFLAVYYLTRRKTIFPDLA